jgi:hypothetical protein
LHFAFFLCLLVEFTANQALNRRSPACDYTIASGRLFSPEKGLILWGFGRGLNRTIVGLKRNQDANGVMPSRV